MFSRKDWPKIGVGVFILVAGTLIGAAIPWGLGWVVQTRDSSKLVPELVEELQEVTKGLATLKLFVAQAHPDRDVSYLASAEKLQLLPPDQIEFLAGQLVDASEGGFVNWEHFAASPAIAPLVANFELTPGDFKNYYEIASLDLARE